MSAPYRLAIVASHVIQYQDPFFRLLASDPSVDLTVLYCSRMGLDTYRDADMATTLRWDLDLLRDYRHRFIRNYSPSPGGGYLRLVNPGLFGEIVRGKFDAVILMTGWGSVSALLAIEACRLSDTPVFLYGDSSFPPPESGLRSRIRAGLLRTLFASVTGFMVSGVLNAAYYRHYGADPSRFFLLPWAVENERFAAAGTLDADERRDVRGRYGLEESAVVFVFSAKLVERKDPKTLLRAFSLMRHRDRAALLLLGDGVLRGELEAFAAAAHLENVRFAGFVNQSELPRCYGASDVFVLPSTYEPRGAVINEAMACGLPVVVTDRCGSIGDIVLDGENARIYPAGDAAALASIMDELTSDDARRLAMARRSREIIATWDFARGVEGVKVMLRRVREGLL